jgi:PAS domain S-box-containing protein
LTETDKTDMDIFSPLNNEENSGPFFPSRGGEVPDIKNKQDDSQCVYAETILEHLPEGVALFDARDNLRLLIMNSRFLAMLKPIWTEEQYIGHTLEELLAFVNLGSAQGDIVTVFRRVVKTGKTYRAEEYEVIGPRLGTSYWNWTVEPILEHDQVKYLFLRLLDVTDQVVAHQQEAQEHSTVEKEWQRLYTILNQLPEGVLLVNARTSEISYANPAAAQLLGFDLSRLIGIPLNQSELLSPYDVSGKNPQTIFRWNFALIDALWGKTNKNQELYIRRPNGSEIVVLSSVAPIRGVNGLINEAIIVFQDVTALKQLEQQKAEFFAVANHELRTPLTIIVGFAELLLQQNQDDTNTMRQYAMKSIMQEGEHLTQLLHDFLDVSHLERSQLDVRRTFQDILAPLQQIVTKYAYTTSSHHVRICLDNVRETDQLRGWFDIARIEQIMSNLLSNAIKYSPVDSEIEVGLQPQRDSKGVAQDMLIWVKDYGIGIAADKLLHIFERFYRVDTIDASISGFGIGLYLAKEIVHGHGGHIWVISKEGQGSTFFMRFPLGEKWSPVR